MFDFDEPINRRGSASYKWDSAPNDETIPMWVADMDFRTAPCVVEALRSRVEHGIFGYTRVPDQYYDALTGWFEREHGWRFSREQVIYTIGVVPALSAIIKALTRPGDGVILPTPAYNCFFSSIRNNGCEIVESPLLSRAGVPACDFPEGIDFSMDFADIERLAANPKNKLLILCNPHNPTGRVWTRSELETLRDICACHGVRVISDEIHCELTHPGYEYLPYALVDPQAIVCCSPSKAFNTAGLQIANIICPDEVIRAKVDRAINDNEVCDVNPFGVVGLIAAYNEGKPWLTALNAYLYENYLLLREQFATRMPQAKVTNSQSTYLAWIDVSAIGTGAEVKRLAMERTNVWMNGGGMYGNDNFIRINFACPRARLREGLDRFFRAFEQR